VITSIAGRRPGLGVRRSTPRQDDRSFAGAAHVSHSQWDRSISAERTQGNLRGLHDQPTAMGVTTVQLACG